MVTKDVGSGVFYVLYEGLANSYEDINLTSGGSYNYKIKAVNLVGEGPESATLVGVAG